MHQKRYSSISTKVGRNLWEVRSRLPHGRIARVLFFVVAGQMVLLQGFIKKTRKASKPDIDLALRRMKGDHALERKTLDRQ
jgi:phage-related protein